MIPASGLSSGCLDWVTGIQICAGGRRSIVTAANMAAPHETSHDTLDDFRSAVLRGNRQHRAWEDFSTGHGVRMSRTLPSDHSETGRTTAPKGVYRRIREPVEIPDAGRLPMWQPDLPWNFSLVSRIGVALLLAKILGYESCRGPVKF